MRLVVISIFVSLAYVPLVWGQSTRVGFTIAFQGVETDLGIMTASVMPAEHLHIKTDAVARAERGTLKPVSRGWQWQAPVNPGHYAINFHQGEEQMVLQIFVLTPFENGEQEFLGGFRVGSYQQELYRELQTYSAPRGFINLTGELAKVKVSPSFSVGQFISKQQPEHDATYLLVLPPMLIKLETLLEAANERGWKASTLYVMSGFRTPYYNRAIGNTTTTSRHLYGGAADVWIDGDEDGLMDDLNGDGIIDKNDAVTLAQLAESLAAKGGRNWPTGGIGIYDSTPAHGPFVHIDARGYRARW